jgi:phosphoribosyl 1,2-cyclic phosphodiesterase
MTFCPLASGSKGNCLFLKSKQTSILIDAGLSFTHIQQRMDEIHADLKTVEAILVTHEHSDHIKGLGVVAEKLKVPILANAETAKGICSFLKYRPKFKIFTTGETFEFKDLQVHPFSIPHDTLDPVAFRIKIADVVFGICADLGHVTSLVKKNLEGCDYLYLESNHEPSMVHASSRPEMLKRRILGKQGHLSNEECALLINALTHPKLKHIYLAHLSSECNAHEVAMQKVLEKLKQKDLSLSIAFQDKVSKIISF